MSPAAEVDRGQVPGVAVRSGARAGVGVDEPVAAARAWAPPRARARRCVQAVRQRFARPFGLRPVLASASSSIRSSPGQVGACGRRSGRRRSLVAVVVLGDQRPVRPDQRLVGRARALAEHGPSRPGAPSPSSSPCPCARRSARASLPVPGQSDGPPVDDDVHRVGVVGDRHVVAPISVGVVPEPASRLARLVHRRSSRRPRARLTADLAVAGVEPVERRVGDDEDAAGLVDGEGVRDPLAESRSVRTSPLPRSIVADRPAVARRTRAARASRAATEMIPSPAGTARLRS